MNIFQVEKKNLAGGGVEFNIYRQHQEVSLNIYAAATLNEALRIVRKKKVNNSFNAPLENHTLENEMNFILFFFC